MRNETFNRLSALEHVPQFRNRLFPRRPSHLFRRAICLPFALSMEDSFSADHFFKLGEDARGAGVDAKAFAYFTRANSLIYRHGPTAQALLAMSNECYQASALAMEYEKFPCWCVVSKWTPATAMPEPPL